MTENRVPRILVIDDDDSALDVLRKMLEASRYAVDTAPSAQTALNRLNEASYEAIVCDMRMPGMSGKEFYRQLRDRFPQYRERILFMTGDLVSEEIWDFIEERRLPYVLKPFNQPEFVRKLADIAGTPPEPAKPARSGIEERRYRRVAMKANARVREKRWATRPPEVVAISNASKGGIYFITERQYRQGTDVMVCFPYLGGADLEQDGFVVRVEDKQPGRYAVAIAMGDAAVEARKSYAKAQEERRSTNIQPLAHPVAQPQVIQAGGLTAELSELKQKMSMEREESRRLAEQLADLREHYEQVRLQRDRLATDEATLTAQLRELKDARAKMTRVIEDMNGQMGSLQHQLAEGEAYRFQATHDSLTGVWNRGAILQILMDELARSGREGIDVSVVLVDLDHFKRVNDTHGHLAGDAVLQEAARRMLGSVRDYDSVGRYGGEEFLIVLPGCNSEQAVRQAERVRARLAAEPIDSGDAHLTVTASLGVAACMRANTEVEALLKVADGALYQAKREGRNRVIAADGATATAEKAQ